MDRVPIECVFFDIGDTLVDRGRNWIPGAREALQRLSAQGLRLGLISNTGDLDRIGLARLLPPDFSFDDFEAALVVLSAEVGMSKPDVRIFAHAIRQARAAPSACVFVGESLEETVAAQASGMRAVRLIAGRGELARLTPLLVPERA